jgi:uncharacterized protein DUF4160
VPRICEFFGIVVSMYYNDHEPAHFHAVYAEHEAVVTIGSLEVLQGYLPARAGASCWNGVRCIGMRWRRTGSARGQACPLNQFRRWSRSNHGKS